MRQLLTGLLLVWCRCAFSQNPIPVSYEQIHAFDGAHGQYGYAPLTEASDGKLYGTCVNGGVLDGGVVFRMNTDRSGYEVLHDFMPHMPTDGLSPWGTVIEGSDGSLYGATRHGGLSDAGIIFKLNKDGTAFAIVRSFTTNVGEGAYPLNGVIEGSDGRLYGRTLRGGAKNGNAIFRLNRDGSGYTILHSFGALLADHYTPYSGLIEASDGALYGTTVADGAYRIGSVFKIQKDGSGFISLYDFPLTDTNGYWPEAVLVEASDGRLYGTTTAGGAFDSGALFTLKKDGSDFRVIHHFLQEEVDGYNPTSPPSEGPGGLLYGTTYFGGYADSGTLYAINKSGANFSIIYRFGEFPTDGWGPYAEMRWSRDGGLYGATFGGGPDGSGTLFRITPVVLTAQVAGPDVLLNLGGFKTHHYGVDASEQMTNDWVRIATVTNLTGTVQLRTPRSAGYRFYRAEVLNP